MLFSGFLVAIILGWGVLWLMVSLAFDRVIKHLYENYQEDWLAMGKPRGMFYEPPKSSYFAMILTSFEFDGDIPYWAEGDVKAVKLYEKFLFWEKISKRFFQWSLPMLLLAVLFLR